MSRKNIFELLAENKDMNKDVERMMTLFTHYYYVESPERLTLREFVDRYCFSRWKGKGRCIDLDDFFETISFFEMQDYLKTHEDLDTFLTVVETIKNMLLIAENYIELANMEYRCFDTGEQLRQLMDSCLSDYNHKAYYDENEEKCIVIEDTPQVTAAAEAVDPDIAFAIVRYHHRLLTGDIAKKKAILKTLGDYLEGKEHDITAIDNALYKTITGCLNNFDIRHNNTDPNNKDTYRKAIAEMPAEELEAHYDDVYQMILLAILEIDNVQRKRDMKALIQKVCAKDDL